MKKIIEFVTKLGTKINDNILVISAVIMFLSGLALGVKIEMLKAKNAALMEKLSTEKAVNEALLIDVAAITILANKNEKICVEQLKQRGAVQKIFENSGVGTPAVSPLPTPRPYKSEVVNEKTSVDAVNFINNIFGLRGGTAAGD
jgi:uncharacterized membrane protein